MSYERTRNYYDSSRRLRQPAGHRHFSLAVWALAPVLGGMRQEPGPTPQRLIHAENQGVWIKVTLSN